jgi:uncharacterized protein (TIGR02145 family)
MFLKELQNKLFIFIFLFTASTIKTSAQFLGGQIKTKGNNYPTGTIYCFYGPTVIVDVINPTTGKIWMDRNLGARRAANSETDSSSYGGYYQWGRRSDGHQCRNSPTTSTISSTAQPSDGNFILSPNTPNDWQSPQNINLWQGVNGINNPCPTGYRLPTYSELDSERLSWSSNNSTGAFTSLKLSRAGYRYWDSGFVSFGLNGRYWSSTINGTFSCFLYFTATTSYMQNDGNRATGYSVRCIKN